MWVTITPNFEPPLTEPAPAAAARARHESGGAGDAVSNTHCKYLSWGSIKLVDSISLNINHLCKKNLGSRHGSHLPIQSVNMFKQGETDMGDKGKKDKGKKEHQKKAKLNLKDKRKQKKEKQTRGTF